MSNKGVSIPRTRDSESFSEIQKVSLISGNWHTGFLSRVNLASLPFALRSGEVQHSELLTQTRAPTPFGGHKRKNPSRKD